MLGTLGKNGGLLDQPGRTAPGSCHNVGWGFRAQGLCCSPPTYWRHWDPGTAPGRQHVSCPAQRTWQTRTPPWGSSGLIGSGGRDPTMMRWALGASRSGPSSCTGVQRQLATLAMDCTRYPSKLAAEAEVGNEDWIFVMKNNGSESWCDDGRVRVRHVLFSMVLPPGVFTPDVALFPVLKFVKRLGILVEKGPCPPSIGGQGGEYPRTHPPRTSKKVLPPPRPTTYLLLFPPLTGWPPEAVEKLTIFVQSCQNFAAFWVHLCLPRISV